MRTSRGNEVDDKDSQRLRCGMIHSQRHDAEMSNPDDAVTHILEAHRDQQDSFNALRNSKQYPQNDSLRDLRPRRSP